MFFILTGYKFRPGCNNPYFKVEEEDLAEVVTKTAITEKVQKRKDKSGEKKVKSIVIKWDASSRWPFRPNSTWVVLPVENRKKIIISL